MRLLSKKTCLCGISVHNGTKWIGIIFLIIFVLNSINDVVNLANNQAPASKIVLNVLINLTGLVIIGMLLYGQQTRRRVFYWPFMVVHVIGVVCFLAFSIILLVFGGAFFGLIENLPKELDAHDSYQQLGQPHPKFSNKEEEEYQDFRKIAGFLGAGLSIVIIATSILFIFISAIYAYFLSVVIRGYRFLKNNSNSNVYNVVCIEQKELV